MGCARLATGLVAVLGRGACALGPSLADDRIWTHAAPAPASAPVGAWIPWRCDGDVEVAERTLAFAVPDDALRRLARDGAAAAAALARLATSDNFTGDVRCEQLAAFGWTGTVPTLSIDGR